MTDATEFYREIMRPALALALPHIEIASSPQAERLLLAVAGQESAWTHRYQILSRGRKGAARGFWHFEKIGVRGVLEHRATKDRAKDLLTGLGYLSGRSYDYVTIWQAIETDDALAVGLARLLWWGDPWALPVTEASAWSGYLRLWRPGKPHPERWGRCWRQACDAIADHGGEYD